MTGVVYRSTRPEVLAHWDATATEEAHKVWRAQVELIIADLGFPGRRFATSSGWRGVKVIGVEHPKGEPVPAGWRRDRGLPEAIVPARRTRQGKAIGARLEEVAAPNPRRELPGGMPEMAFSRKSVTLMRPGVERRGDAVFVTWPKEIEEGDAGRIDPAVWERMRLSEYWAAVEAEQDSIELMRTDASHHPTSAPVGHDSDGQEVADRG